MKLQDEVTYQRKVFLRDHPPIIMPVKLQAGSAKQELLAGTVIGKNTQNSQIGIYKATEHEEPLGILIEDITVPTGGNGAIGHIYVHADCVKENIIFDNAVNAENKTKAIAKLCALGVYIY